MNLPEIEMSSPWFLSGGGELGRLIREFDWSSTPLGPVSVWPHTLRASLSICLNSSFPTAIYWGPDLRLIYNDAWSTIPAERHPWALGRPGAEVWQDIWDVVGPQIAKVIASGQGFSTFNEMLPIVRNGKPQETYWNYSLTPIWGDDGRIAGVFNQGNETTEVVLGRRRAEAEIERLAHMFEQAPGAIAMTRGPSHVLDLVNSAYEEMIERRHILGKTVAEALPEVVGQGFVDLLDKVYSTGEPYVGRAVPVMLRRGNYIEERILDFVYQPVNDLNGERSGIFVQATDVTEAARAEQALRDSEERYEAIVNTIDQMIWSTRPDGFHDYYNDRWYEFTGVPYGSTDGEAWNEMFHPDDRARAWEIWHHSLETGERYHIEYRLRHRSGEYRWVIGRAQCLRNEKGEITRWYGTCTDIHAQKLAEKALAEQAETLAAAIRIRHQNEIALRESEHFNRSVVESSGDCIKVMNLDGSMQFMNENGRILMEIDDFEKIRGNSWLSHWPEESRPQVQEAMETARAGGAARFSAFRYTAKGTPKWWDVVVTPVLGADGAPLRMVSIARDVTAQRNAEEARDLLVRELNHRVKNLFAITSGMVTMTARSAGSPAEMAATLKGRLAALAKAHELIRTAMITDADNPAACLETLIAEVVRPHLSPTRDDQFACSGGWIGLREKSSTSLALILHELATNAAKYGALATEDGRLDVTWVERDGKLELHWREFVGQDTISPPTTLGFGSRLAESSVAGQLGGSIEYDWKSGGVQILLNVPLENLER